MILAVKTSRATFSIHLQIDGEYLKCKYDTLWRKWLLVGGVDEPKIPLQIFKLLFWGGLFFWRMKIDANNEHEAPAVNKSDDELTKNDDDVRASRKQFAKCLTGCRFHRCSETPVDIHRTCKMSPRADTSYCRKHICICQVNPETVRLFK